MGAVPNAEAFVFYGSRTHFNYGYPPEADSDLDARIYVSWEGRNGGREFYAGLADARQALGVPFNFSRRYGLESACRGREFTFPIDRSSEQEIFAGAERMFGIRLSPARIRQRTRDRLYQLSPHVLPLERERSRRGHFDLRTGDLGVVCHINKEALILLRRREATEDIIAQLRTLDYPNVFVLDF
jgi:hypothetical protein